MYPVERDHLVLERNSVAQAGRGENVHVEGEEEGEG
jgi:hypothetical protein